MWTLLHDLPHPLDALDISAQPFSAELALTVIEGITRGHPSLGRLKLLRLPERNCLRLRAGQDEAEVAAALEQVAGLAEARGAAVEFV